VHEGNAWSRIAPSFGISKIQNLLCVFVVLPDDYGCYGDRYRKHLILQRDKQTLTCEAFRLDIAQNIPSRIQAKMNAGMMKTSNGTIAKIKDFMKDLPFLRQLGLSGGDYMTGRGSGSSSGNGKSRAPKTNTGSNPNTTKIKGIADASGKSRAVVEPPEFYWIAESDLAEIENSGLRGRIGEYRPGPSGGTLVLNEFCPTFKTLVAMLLRLADVPEGLEQVAHTQASNLLKNKVEFRLAQCVLIRQSTKGSLDWTDAQIDASLRQDGLENFATPIFAELKMLRRNLNEAPAYRAALAQHSGGAATLGVIKMTPPVKLDEEEVDDEFLYFPN
jgi:hypothetical protein